MFCFLLSEEKRIKAVSFGCNCPKQMQLDYLYTPKQEINPSIKIQLLIQTNCRIPIGDDAIQLRYEKPTAGCGLNGICKKNLVPDESGNCP